MNAVNHVYKLLVLRAEDPDEYERQIQFGSRYTAQWDEPDTPSPEGSQSGNGRREA